MRKETNKARIVKFLVPITMGIALSGCGGGKTAAKPPTPSVVVKTPEQKEVLEYEELPGRVDAIEDVEVKARVTGYLNTINFTEGAEVKKGDLLYTIDPREYQADQESAAAALEQAKAKLAQAKSDYDRATQLSKNTVIAKQELETRGTAVVDAAAGVRAAEASLARAQLNVEYTEIRAPITGKISRTNVTAGNLVADGDTLTTIVSQDPVYVYFEAPERVVLRWDKAVKDATGDALTDQMRAEVGLLNEDGFPREGRVDFADNELNTGTGTLGLRAVMDNKDRQLRVGLYARVRVSLNHPYKTLLVPERAVGVDQGQRFVYVVDKDDKVEYRKVTTGQIYGRSLSILDGLQPTDRVVTEGLLSLRPGMTVQPEAKTEVAAK